VELHGGTVTASSAGENAGSVFEVRLPIRTADAPVIEAPLPETHAPTLRGLSVLVVDDDPGSREFVRTTLEHSGAVVVSASSAREARERLKREPVDIVVSDIVMPHEDGFELIRHVRELDAKSGRHTPAIALTALARTDDRRRALDAGYQMHVAKPIDAIELVSTVERLAEDARGIALAER
jgi:CheY-like chemotaxis protein